MNQIHFYDQKNPLFQNADEAGRFLMNVRNFKVYSSEMFCGNIIYHLINNPLVAILEDSGAPTNILAFTEPYEGESGGQEVDLIVAVSTSLQPCGEYETLVEKVQAWGFKYHGGQPWTVNGLEE